MLEVLPALLARGPVAMISVLAAEGSAPRGAGTRMLVTADASIGTIGGGRLEYVAVEQARVALGREPGAWRVQDYPLGPLLGQCCGGRVRLLVEHLHPEDCAWAGEPDGMLVSVLEDGRIARRVERKLPPTCLSARGELPGTGMVIVEPLEEAKRQVGLFGAGHVGQAISRACAGLPLSFSWFDLRAEMAEISGVTQASEEEMLAWIAQADEQTAILVLTHDHGLDYSLTAAALRSGAGFVGMIGSATKRARFEGRFRADGVDFTRLACPVGLPGIKGKQPEVIAIAVAAQLLSLGPVAAFRAV